MKYPQQGGLLPLPHDPRDLPTGSIITYPALAELPSRFSLGTGWIEDQQENGEPDFCGSHTFCGASELQEGVRLARRWAFAAAKTISGNPDEWGIDLRSMAKSHVKFGAPEALDLSIEELTLPSSQARRLENYRPELKEKAKRHKKETFLAVTGPYDTYDNIRALIWKFRKEKRAVCTGVEFGWRLEDYMLEGFPPGFGHAMYITGWNEEEKEVNKGADIVNSYGSRAGKNGVHRIARETINRYASLYGAYMLVDLPRDEVEHMIRTGIKDADPSFARLGKTIRTYIGEFGKKIIVSFLRICSKF